MTNDSKDMGPPQLVAASTTTVQLMGGDTVVRMAVPERTRELLASDEAAAPRRLMLRIEDLEVDAPPGASYNVFLLDPGSSTADVEAYLGTVTLFGVEMLDVPGHDHAPGYRKAFDVTDVFARRAGGGKDTDEISVVFVPIMTGSEDEETRARLLDEQTRRIEQANVRVGRVALYAS